MLKTAACVEQNCWFTQEGPCYAALGDKLNLLMMVPDTSKYELKIQKSMSSTEKDPFCRVRNNTMKKNQCDLFNNRPEVSVINGILIINGVIRADSGTYRLILEDSDDTETSRDLQVIVEGLEFNCSFNQSDPCYAALGHKLSLQMADTSIYNLTIKKKISSTQDDPVCKIKKGTIKRSGCHLYNNRPEVSVNNGILIINGVIRADSGTYRLVVEDSNGTETTKYLQVIVEESSASLVFVLVWCFQLMFLLGLLGGFHIYMRHTSGKKQEDQQVRMSRFREGHEHTAED